MKRILMIGTGGTIASGKTAEGPYAGVDERAASVVRPGGIVAVPGRVSAASVAGQHKSCPNALASDCKGHPGAVRPL